MSHKLQNALSSLERVEEHHYHNHHHTHHGHQHVDHAHPFLDFLKDLSRQTEAPVNSGDLKIPHLTFHISAEAKNTHLPFAATKKPSAFYLPVPLEGYAGTSTPPPRV